MNWRDQSAGDIIEDLRRLVEDLDKHGFRWFDPPEPHFLISLTAYNRIVKMTKRRAQRAARRVRERRKKTRGW